ncbi:hypothetical protein HK101_006251 [Irineochytrium annulatum]|nr:hypothetical protein HK101_006251 [Irineochytrium annulatum]
MAMATASASALNSSQGRFGGDSAPGRVAGGAGSKDSLIPLIPLRLEDELDRQLLEDLSFDAPFDADISAIQSTPAATNRHGPDFSFGAASQAHGESPSRSHRGSRSMADLDAAHQQRSFHFLNLAIAEEGAVVSALRTLQDKVTTLEQEKVDAKDVISGLQDDLERTRRLLTERGKPTLQSRTSLAPTPLSMSTAHIRSANTTQQPSTARLSADDPLSPSDVKLHELQEQLRRQQEGLRMRQLKSASADPIASRVPSVYRDSSTAPPVPSAPPRATPFPDPFPSNAFSPVASGSTAQRSRADSMERRLRMLEEELGETKRALKREIEERDRRGGQRFEPVVSAPPQGTSREDARSPLLPVDVPWFEKNADAERLRVEKLELEQQLAQMKARASFLERQLEHARGVQTSAETERDEFRHELLMLQRGIGRREVRLSSMGLGGRDREEAPTFPPRPLLNDDTIDEGEAPPWAASSGSQRPFAESEWRPLEEDMEVLESFANGAGEEEEEEARVVVEGVEDATAEVGELEGRRSQASSPGVSAGRRSRASSVGVGAAEDRSFLEREEIETLREEIDRIRSEARTNVPSMANRRKESPPRNAAPTWKRVGGGGGVDRSTERLRKMPHDRPLSRKGSSDVESEKRAGEESHEHREHGEIAFRHSKPAKSFFAFEDTQSNSLLRVQQEKTKSLRKCCDGERGRTMPRPYSAGVKPGARGRHYDHAEHHSQILEERNAHGGKEGIETVLSLLEDEFADCKSRYHRLVNLYESLAEEASESGPNEGSTSTAGANGHSKRGGKRRLRNIGDELRDVIQDMEAKGDQIAILRDICRSSAKHELRVREREKQKVRERSHRHQLRPQAKTGSSSGLSTKSRSLERRLQYNRDQQEAYKVKVATQKANRVKEEASRHFVARRVPSMSGDETHMRPLIPRSVRSPTGSFRNVSAGNASIGSGAHSDAGTKRRSAASGPSRPTQRATRQPRGGDRCAVGASITSASLRSSRSPSPTFMRASQGSGGSGVERNLSLLKSSLKVQESLKGR